MENLSETTSKENNESPTFTTIIQLMTENPYKVVITYPFLYNPADDSKVTIEDKEFHLSEISDRINSNGDIRRYVRYYGV